jgi:UDP-N-acetylmuramate dehydrogenase
MRHATIPGEEAFHPAAAAGCGLGVVVVVEPTVVSSARTQLRDLRRSGEIEVYERVDLRAWTTARIGGTADLLIRCLTIDGTQQTIDVLASHGLPWITLGAGSRLVVSDKGLRVPAMSLHGQLARWETDDDGAVVGAGAKLTQLCRAMALAGLSGLENLAGRAGTLGGTVVKMLKSGSEALDSVLDWIEIVHPGGPPKRIAPPLSRAAPAGSGIGEREVAVKARLALEHDRQAAIQARTNQPLASVGRGPGFIERVFENPSGASAEKLLRRAECLNLKVGGARVSERDANTILTSRRATAVDVISLCREMRERVRAHFGCELEAAVILIDEEGEVSTP